MLKITTVVACKNWAKGQVAFVPTMGALHAGHVSLINLAKKTADKVIVSIFVNPEQFGPNEDFVSYPRQLEQDLLLLEQVGVDAVFIPDNNEIYPLKNKYKITPNCLADDLCGKFRPGHFSGVSTVVLKLLNCIKPDFLVLGAKDYQQVVIVKNLIRDFLLDCKVVIAPIAREDNGLAMSSRNAYLDIRDRDNARHLYKALQSIKSLITQGENVNKACEKYKNYLIKYGYRLDYLLVRNADDLSNNLSDNLVILVAAWLGSVRLIDNLVCRR